MKPLLCIEELEDRIAPTVVAAGGTLTFTDANGDHITVTYDGAEGSSVDIRGPLGADIADGSDISTITFAAASAASALRITSDGAGQNDIVITVAISAPSQDVGSIVLGYADGGAEAGNVVFSPGVTVDIGGALGLFADNGNLDCDEGNQSITAGGDIGAIFLRNLILDSSIANGEARIAAGGAGGAGNISFIVVGNVFARTDATVPGGYLDLSVPVTVPDDAGRGDLGDVFMSLSGGAGEGSFLPIAVTGGGFVIANVIVNSSGTTLVAIGQGAGGDLSTVDFDPGAAGLDISGAADTDVLLVSALGSLNGVVNRAFGGDIGSVIGDGDLGLLQTASSGTLGAIFTGFDNSLPLLTRLDSLGATIDLLGGIGTVKAGGIYGNAIVAASIGGVSVGPGGIQYAVIDTTGGIGPVSAGSIYQSDIITDGTIGAVKIGLDGMSDSSITGFGGIQSVASKGAVLFSLITATSLGATVSGGTISSVTAPLLVQTTIDAFEHIGTVTVKGEMIRSTITTRFDDGLGGFVGGDIGTVSVGAMVDTSVIESNHGITTVKVGSSGMTANSTVFAHGDMTSVKVSGDVSNSDIFADGAVGSVSISGDVTATSEISSVSINTLSIGGSVSDSTVFIDAAAGRISVKGGVAQSAFDVGSATSVSVSKSVVSSDIIGPGSLGSLTVGGNLTDAVVSMGADIGPISVKGVVGQATINAGFDDAGLPTAGSIASLSAGSITASNITASRDIDKVSVKGTVTATTIASTAADNFGLGDTITGGGSIGAFKAGGLVGSAVEAFVNVGKVTLGSFGADFGSTITTFTGNLAGLTTSGLVRGVITVEGDLTGSIPTAGTDAPFFDGAFHFTDPNGQPTDGLLLVFGSIAQNVKIS